MNKQGVGWVIPAMKRDIKELKSKARRARCRFRIGTTEYDIYGEALSAYAGTLDRLASIIESDIEKMLKKSSAPDSTQD